MVVNLIEKPLRVLFVNRPDIATMPGGDVVQMEETQKELQQLGVQVDISTDLHPGADGYDLIHLFNLETPDTGLIQARHVAQQGKPIALSTIYWDLGDERRFRSFYEFGKYQFLKKITGRPVSRAVWKRLYQKTRQRQQALLNLVSLILPNSRAEGEQVSKNFQLPTTTKVSVVVNGVKPSQTSGNAQRFFEKYGFSNVILEVGRLGFIKNQLNLLRALRGSTYSIVLAGQVTDPSYAQRCYREARGRQVLFLPHLNQPELLDAYAAARVHVLPSQKDTVGLVSLEAALQGCRIVSTTNGGGREYLQDDAEYCNPDDLTSIRSAVDRAWNLPVPIKLIDRIRKEYTWRRAAEQTLEAYRRLLNA